MEDILEYFKKGTKNLNENKYFIGTAMILVNIGARFIIDELDDETRGYISNGIVRKLFIFCSLFMATRDIFTAFILTVVFAVILNEFLGKDEKDNKNSKEEKGSSFNKSEIDNAIQKLKTVHTNL
jgi:hypothetical protein